MTYQRQSWRDGDRNTPLSAARLNHIESGISSAHDPATISNTLRDYQGFREYLAEEIQAKLPNSQNVERLVIEEVDRAIKALPPASDQTQAIKAAVDSALMRAVAEIPGWHHATGNEPGAEHADLPNGSYLYTQANGRVYRKEAGKWVYKGFNSQAVTDNQVAFQLLNGPLTQAALAEITGIPVPYRNDYNQPRLTFAGREWVARDSSWKSGGPNAGDQWAASNVTVDRGKAVLKLTNEGSLPVGAELVSVQSMGYGTYELEFETDFSAFDKHAVFGFFTFDWEDDVSGHGEIDAVEISKWGRDTLKAKLTHYPDSSPVHSPDFSWPEGTSRGIVRMVWEPGKVTWTLIDAATKRTLHTASTTDRVPTPRKNQVHINLWAFNSDGWQSAAPVTATIHSFNYIRSSHVISSAPQSSAPAVSNKVPALQKFFTPGKRYLAPVTYWWPDRHYNSKSAWHLVFEHPDLIPFVILNISSGAGSKREQDAVTFLKECRANSIPVIGYVRTVTDLGQRIMRPTEDIKNEVKKFREFYGEDIQGIFYDEAPGGWDAKSVEQVPIYKELHDWAKQEFGIDFLVVANPGSPTKEGLLECADVLMTFEQAPERYFSTESNLVPDWYKDQPPYRFWHVLHDVKNEKQARDILAKAEKSNVATIYLTDDTFSGVIGSESESNNPWDRRPSKWLEKLQTDWCRRVLQDPKAGSEGSFNVQIITSADQEKELEVGTFWVLVPDNEGTPVKITGSTSGNLNAREIGISIPGAKTGDKVLIAVNTKANGTESISGPPGFTKLMDAYYVGTQKSWVFSGDYGDNLKVTGTADTEFGYAAIAVSGASRVTAGTPKDRKQQPAESTTITAPRAEAQDGDLVVGVAFERTSATETTAQVTVSEGWNKVVYSEQDVNYQTALIASGGTGDMTVTYPNSQAANGVGVQVVFHAT